MMLESQEIAVIGGTGSLGSGLARRWANAGLSILIGSRDAGKADEFARRLMGEGGGGMVTGLTNVDAATRASIVVLAVPFGSQQATLEDIKPHVEGKIVLDATVPLVPPKVARVQLPPEGSAALRAHAILGDGVRLISGFHNVAAHKLPGTDEIACDTLIFGDEVEARDIGVALAEHAGLRGVHGGPLANSAAAEAMTSVLIFINKRYKADGAGLQISGLAGSDC